MSCSTASRACAGGRPHPASTHYLEEARQLCDRVAIARGPVVALDPPARRRCTSSGRDPRAARRRRRALRAEGLRARGMSLRRVRDPRRSLPYTKHTAAQLLAALGEQSLATSTSPHAADARRRHLRHRRPLRPRSRPLKARRERTERQSRKDPRYGRYSHPHSGYPAHHQGTCAPLARAADARAPPRGADGRQPAPDRGAADRADHARAGRRACIEGRHGRPSFGDRLPVVRRGRHRRPGDSVELHPRA